MRHPIVEADLDRILESPLPWERFADRTVLITGAGGFLGAYMVETLLRLNEYGSLAPVRVLALARRPGVLNERFGAYRSRDDLQFLVQDACTPVASSEAIHFIVHAASPGTPRTFGKDPLGTFNANVFATRELLELRPSEGFLFFSSGEVYGLGNDQVIPTPEDAYGFLDPTQVRSCYGEGKRAGETLCACYVAQEGVPAIIARIFHTYGPGMTLSDGRVFSDFVGDALAGRELVIRSDGRASRSFSYLADTITGCFTVLLKGEIGTAYNVGNDQAELSVLELANLIAALEPERGLQVRWGSVAASDSYLRSPIHRTCPDVSRLRGLGWEPQIEPREGFSRTLNSFR